MPWLFASMLSICSVIEKDRKDESLRVWVVEQLVHFCSLFVVFEHIGQMKWLVEVGFDSLRNRLTLCQLDGVLHTPKTFSKEIMSSIHFVESRCCFFKSTKAIAISLALISSRISNCISFSSSDICPFDILNRDVRQTTDEKLVLSQVYFHCCCGQSRRPVARHSHRWNHWIPYSCRQVDHSVEHCFDLRNAWKHQIHFQAGTAAHLQVKRCIQYQPQWNSSNNLNEWLYRSFLIAAIVLICFAGKS